MKDSKKIQKEISSKLPLFQNVERFMNYINKQNDKETYLKNLDEYVPVMNNLTKHIKSYLVQSAEDLKKFLRGELVYDDNSVHPEEELSEREEPDVREERQDG